MTEPEIAEKIARLAYLGKSIYAITAKQCKDASNISTSLFFKRIIPNSDFEFFINKVDFKLLTYKNIFEYYKMLPIDKRDSFLNAYGTYKTFNSNYYTSDVYSVPRAFLSNSYSKVKEYNIINLYNSPELYSPNAPQIVWNMIKLVYLGKSMYFSTAKLQKEASSISTYLLFERRLPNSDFEFFINKVDFKLLTSKSVFEYYRELPEYERDLFSHAYDNYKKIHTNRNAPNTYNVLLNKLYRKLPAKVKFFGKMFKKLITKWSVKPIEVDFAILKSTPLIFIPHEIDIFLKIERLAELEESMFIWTQKSLTEASEISTFLVRQLRLPNSNFEHFINHVNFNSLTDKNIFEFSRILTTDQLDMFIYAYEKYKRS